MIRGFLAIGLPSDVRAKLATIQQDLQRHIEQPVDRQIRISWVRPASMHLTVRFLGDVPEGSINLLRTGIEQTALARQPLSLPLERIGVFPNRTQPRVLWIGPSESWQQGPEAKRLTALHRAIEQCCQAAGFASDARPFTPHLTLARVKKGERLVSRALVSSDMLDRSVTGGMLTLDAIAFIQSELRPSGSIYTKLWEACPGSSDRCGLD